MDGNTTNKVGIHLQMNSGKHNGNENGTGEGKPDRLVIDVSAGKRSYTSHKEKATHKNLNSREYHQ